MPNTSRIGRITAAGGGLSANITALVLGGTLDLSSTEVSQLTITLTESPDFTVLRSGVFVAGTRTKAGSSLEYGRQRFEVRALELGPRGRDHVITVTARSAAACRMARAYGPLARKNTSPSQFARQQAHKYGLEFVGQPLPAKKHIVRQTGKQRESTWDLLQRLAQDAGAWCFEAGDVLYFGRPEWLAKHDADPWRYTWKPGKARQDDRVDELPILRRTGDSKRRRAAEVTVAARGEDAETMLPGRALVLEGIPAFSGRYLVAGVSLTLGTSAPVSITGATAENPEDDE